jgi:taurine dioxygenase
MPVALLEKLRSLKLVKCSNHFVDNIWPSRMSNRQPDVFYGNTASVQPAVLRHPVSGEEVINICQEFTSHVCGWSDAQSDDLFGQVARWQYDAGNLFRHRWKKGDLVVWDNFATQHARETLTPGATRHFQRVLVHPWDAEELEKRTGHASAQTDLHSA